MLASLSEFPPFILFYLITMIMLGINYIFLIVGDGLKAADNIIAILPQNSY